MESRLKVAVIGSGAAGLCAVRHLSADPKHFEFDIFEKKHYVGGIWNYSETVGYDEDGLPIESSIYKNLITNIPKETMAFPDFPFPDNGGRSYIHHKQVLQYLQEYAKHYDLYKHIQFHKMVVHVKPLKHSGGQIKWWLTYSDVVTKEKETKVYDAVMVCNGSHHAFCNSNPPCFTMVLATAFAISFRGRYSVPNMPEIPGLNDFQGILMHSQAYRENTSFKDLTVVIMGAGPSGEDIGFEIAKVARKVILSHNSKIKTCPLPKNMIQRKGVDHVDKSSVTLIDGQTYDCDAIVLCTGYLVDYPFLDPSCNLRINDQRITPLYLHTFHIDYPTLAIWGVLRYFLPFPVFDQQVKVFLKFLKGDITLPSPDKMREEEERDFKSWLGLGYKPSHAHDMRGDRIWKFDDELSKVGRIDPIPNSIRNLLRNVLKERDENLMNYREINYELIDSETFV